ncbi:MAG TPA: GWxTD domain-containing protein [Pyrinomonadaceae bacterium]|jgi:GWxTD domain-containing protein|nr:GWxTD domain-containing protein [Pyrinomonadaceae bacterium]
MINKIFIAVIVAGMLTLATFAQKPQKAAVGAVRTLNTQENPKEQAFKSWVERDVLYLITPAEKESFLALRTDGEREQFIESFWRRRDPKPKTPENEFRTEYYSRIAYANEHFPLTPGSITGWQSDRGKTYILMGAPDQIEKGRAPFANLDDIAFEKWTYQNKDLNITFIDPAGDNEFRFLEKGSENLLGAPSIK